MVNSQLDPGKGGRGWEFASVVALSGYPKKLNFMARVRYDQNTDLLARCKTRKLIRKKS